MCLTEAFIIIIIINIIITIISFSYRSQKPAVSVHSKLASATSLDGYSAQFSDKRRVLYETNLCM